MTWVPSCQCRLVTNSLPFLSLITNAASANSASTAQAVTHKAITKLLIWQSLTIARILAFKPKHHQSYLPGAKTGVNKSSLSRFDNSVSRFDVIGCTALVSTCSFFDLFGATNCSFPPLASQNIIG